MQLGILSCGIGFLILFSFLNDFSTAIQEMQPRSWKIYEILLFLIITILIIGNYYISNARNLLILNKIELNIHCWEINILRGQNRKFIYWSVLKFFFWNSTELVYIKITVFYKKKSKKKKIKPIWTNCSAAGISLKWKKRRTLNI